MNYKDYILCFPDFDNVMIRVNQDVQRLDNEDDYSLISDYIQSNYGVVCCEIIEIETLDEIVI